MRQDGNRVTPEEIVAAILVELDRRMAPGYYTNLLSLTYSRSIFTAKTIAICSHSKIRSATKRSGLFTKNCTVEMAVWLLSYSRCQFAKKEAAETL